MPPALQIDQSSLSAADPRGGPESPMNPGVYWFQRETMSRARMLELRGTYGQLTVW
jgi:hypothetical protein